MHWQPLRSMDDYAGRSIDCRRVICMCMYSHMLFHILGVVAV